MTRPLLASLGALALGLTAAAQDPVDPAPAKTRVICSLPAARLPWLADAGSEDGRFTATWTAAVDGEPPGGEPTGDDLRATALATLALLADGSTMRAGPCREPIKKAVLWLLAQRDEHGRLGLRSEPDWIVDQAIGAYALCEAARISEYALMRKRIDGPLAVLSDHLERFAPGDVDPELLAWCRMSARSAAAFAAWWRQQSRAAEEPEWRSGAPRLATEVDRLSTDATPVDARQRAARLLLEVLDESGGDATRIGRLAEPIVATEWPGNMDDPLAVLYGSLALYHLQRRDPDSGSGSGNWRALTDRLRALLIDLQLDDGDLAGSWDPRGPFGERFGRVGTTAVNYLLTTLYYRYCSLEPAS